MVKRHKMDFFMDNDQLRGELRDLYPNGIFTLDLIREGKRTATTRSHPIGEIGERVILYNSNNPECGQVIVEVDKTERLDIDTTEECENWSRREGWSVEHLEKNPGLKTQWQTTFHVVYEYASETALLEEYKSCDELVGRLDPLIWQMASILFPITLAGLTYFGVHEPQTLEQFIVMSTVGLGAITFILTWFYLSRQWYGYQKLAFNRMREIEAELGLWHYRYANFIRLNAKRRKFHLEKSTNEEKERFIALGKSFGPFPHFGLRRSMAVVTAIFVIGWVALIAREAYLLFF